MDASPAAPTSSDNVLEPTGTPIPQVTTAESGPTQTPLGEEPYPPIANEIIRVLDSPPQRHENGYYVRTAVLCWRNELESELVSIASILLICILIIQFNRTACPATH